MATYNVGAGSGSLLIDGSKVKYQAGDVINIKAGKYTGLTIQNISVPSGYVTIQNSGGIVEITGNQNTFNLKALSGVVISGNGASGISQGFYLHDNNYRPLQMSGVFSNFTLQNFLFKNTGDYVISSDFGNTIYNASNPSTFWNGVKILNCEFNNTGQILLDGDITNNKLTGLIKGLEIAYCNFHDMSPGDLVAAYSADGYNIHHNVMNNVNTNNNNHNGLFHMQGNGSFHHNKATNHQGNSLRAWTFSVGDTPKQVLIYNNIIVGSRKYGGFEVQGFPNLLIKGITTYANALCFNNTCGNLNSSHDFSAGVIDVYSLFGGSCEVFNNISFNVYPTSGSTIVNQEADQKINEHNNLYFNTSSLAGIDDNTYIPKVGSPLINKGVITPFEIDDYYGNSRTSGNDIGAVEYTTTTTPPPVTTPPTTTTTTPPPATTTTINVTDLQTLKTILDTLSAWLAAHSTN